MKPPFSSVRLGIVFASYVLLSGLLIQLVLIPRLFPALDAGDGLLVGGDWVLFNREEEFRHRLIEPPPEKMSATDCSGSHAN